LVYVKVGNRLGRNQARGILILRVLVRWAYQLAARLDRHHLRVLVWRFNALLEVPTLLLHPVVYVDVNRRDIYLFMGYSVLNLADFLVIVQIFFCFYHAQFIFLPVVELL
jgi:hypothetical protein